jgi:hypothetical protein
MALCGCGILASRNIKKSILGGDTLLRAAGQLYTSGHFFISPTGTHAVCTFCTHAELSLHQSQRTHPQSPDNLDTVASVWHWDVFLVCLFIESFKTFSQKLDHKTWRIIAIRQQLILRITID